MPPILRSCLWIPFLVLLTLFLIPVTQAQTPTNVSTLPVGSCTATIPCSNQACCNSESGFCGFGPSFCNTVATGGPCTSNCDALAECGPFAAAANFTCPLNVCCSQFGFCGTTDEFCGTGCQSNCNPPALSSCGDDEQTALHRRIGYYEGWAVQSSSRACDIYPPDSISAETLTHVNFAFALISDSFQIVEMTPGDAALWTRTTNLKQRNAALKVFLSIGGWSFNDPPTQNIFSNLVGSAANTATFIASTLNTLQAYGFDGIDIDWEYPAANDRGGVPADRDNYPVFMAQVKAAFSSHGYGLTFTAPSSYWYLQHFDLPNLLKSADWVNIMTYDLHGTWDGNDPYIGKVVLAHTNLTEIIQTMQLFANVGVSPGQMVLGIGFYGRSFQLASSDCTTPGCGFIGGAAPGICSLNSGTLMFTEIETIIEQLSLEPVFVETDAVKYIVWNGDQWVSYDDAQTLQMKLDYANSICLGGTMIWSVDQDDTSYTALQGLYADVDINNPSSFETGDQCQITGCGQGCPANYESLTTLTQIPSVSSSCDPKKPARLCCPVGNAPQSCTWRGGGGHVCNAQCNVGEIVMALDEVGDGSTPTCVQGYKAFCCQSGQGTAGGCFGEGCGDTNCASGYEVQTFVKQGSADNGGCEADQAPPVQPHVCPTICPSSNKPVCCEEGSGYTNCQWTGDVPGCFNAVCSPGQVAVFQDIQGDAPTACTGSNKRTYCCYPPLNSGFLPVSEDWVFPQFSPIDGSGISETATFTADFDDNTGSADTTSSGAGSSGESDDGNENDSPFGEVFISSPNPASVSSVTTDADWVLTDCLRSSDQPQTVLAYCSKPMDSDDSGCGHVFIGQAQNTIVRMPNSCGVGPYARVTSFEVHPNQTVLSGYHMSKKPASELVYSFSFDYEFTAIPSENGPVMMRADMTDMPGYWDAIVNSAPEETSTRRKRDFHRPMELEKRWFGPFDSWLNKLNTLSTGNGLERNFHWSDTYTIFHQEEQCPNFSSSLDVSVSGTASITSAFGYYLEATIIPPAIQECYVYFKAGAGAQATFTITGMAEAHFNSERAELASFGFPGLYYPGLLTLGPSLHLYGELTGQLSMGGSFSASIGYQFPDVDISLGKKDSNGDEQNVSGDTSPNGNNQGFDYGLAYNVDLTGNAEVHIVPSLQLGLSVLGGAVMDAQVFAEADLYAGLSINGSVSSTSAAKICINPHYGVNLNLGFTGSVLFWDTNPLSQNVYAADFTFGGGCFSSVTEPSGSGGTLKRDRESYDYKIVSRAGSGVHSIITHQSSEPAYVEHRTKLSSSVYQSEIRKPLTSWSIKNQSSTVDVEKRGGVPFLPGNIFCPTTNNQISNDSVGTDCSIYANDPTDLDPDQLDDRLARRAGVDLSQTSPSNDSSGYHLQELAAGSAVSSCNISIDIPGYQTTTVQAYYDLASPGTLSPILAAYNPVPPVFLGTTARGQPRLTSANGAPVYAREHVYEESLAGLFVDYLRQSTNLWLDSTGTNDWCDWVAANLVATPAYFINDLENPQSQSVFTQLGNCYPQSGIDSMPIMEQEANKAKNLAMYDGERQLNNLGTKQLRDITNTDWTAKCSSSKVALLRSAAGVISYMNAYPIQSDFLASNRCIRRVWAAWYPLYVASTVDAPNNGNVNVPNLYDNWINTVISGMAPWLRSEVARIIPSVASPDVINLSFNTVLDTFSLTQQIPQGITFTQNNQITTAILTAQITNQIGNINWLVSLPRH